MSGRAETERGVWSVILAEVDGGGGVNSGREEVEGVERDARVKLY